MTAKKKQPEQQEEPYKPMAVQEPTTFERLAALELRMTEMEKAVSQHNRYHFGGYSKE